MAISANNLLHIESDGKDGTTGLKCRGVLGLAKLEFTGGEVEKLERL